MISIKHTFHIDAPIVKVYEALTTIEGLSEWWTRDTVGNCELGDYIYFTFGEHATFEFQVALLNENKLVNWKFEGGYPDWDGTFVAFVLSEQNGLTRMEFVHEEFKDDYEGYGNINFSWAGYLSSLRDYCETGKGKPFSE